jgi:hypothetical protein
VTTDDTLARLLSDGARFAPEYADGLSNHLPMTLVALHRLGADAARMTAWHERYARRLRPAPQADPWPAGDPWPGRLGQLEAWPLYRSLFQQWVDHEGAQEMLAQTVPVLMPGCGAAAFHGPIRVACAARSGHAGELADALAYWACRFLPLGALPAVPGTQADPEPLLQALRAGRSKRSLIFQRMQDAARGADLHAQVARLAIDEHTLERLARLSAKAYAYSGNFTALHLVTGCHAMRVLSAFLDDDDGTALRWFWQAWAAAVVAAAMKASAAPRLLPWEAIVQSALAQDDEHVIKLVDSCREQERAYGGSDWRLAASRAVA